MKILFAAFAFLLTVAANAEASFPILTEGSYSFRSVQWPGTTAPAQPQACEILRQMIVTLSGDVYTANLVTLPVSPCSPKVDPNPRTYHFKRTGDFFCGVTYLSEEKLAGGVVIGGGGFPQAMMNDYRPASGECLHPNDGRPPIFQVIGLQEMSDSGTSNWQTF